MVSRPSDSERRNSTELSPVFPGALEGVEQVELVGFQELPIKEVIHNEPTALWEIAMYYDEETIRGEFGIDNVELARELADKSSFIRLGFVTDENREPTEEALKALNCTKEECEITGPRRGDLQKLNKERFKAALAEAGLPEEIIVPKSEQLIDKQAFLAALSALGVELKGEISNVHYIAENLAKLRDLVMLIEFEDGMVVPVPLADMTQYVNMMGMVTTNNPLFPFGVPEEGKISINGDDLNLPHRGMVYNYRRRGFEKTDRQSPFRKKMARIGVGKYPDLSEVEGPISLGITAEDGSIPTTSLITTLTVDPTQWSQCYQLIAKKDREGDLRARGRRLVREDEVNGGVKDYMMQPTLDELNKDAAESLAQTEQEAFLQTNKVVVAIDVNTGEIFRAGNLQLRNLGVSQLDRMTISIDGEVVPSGTAILAFRNMQEALQFLHKEWTN